MNSLWIRRRLALRGSTMYYEYITLTDVIWFLIEISAAFLILCGGVKMWQKGSVPVKALGVVVMIASGGFLALMAIGWLIIFFS